MRSDLAGETGAVWIYRGILLVTSDTALRRFARRHLVTERKHLRGVRALIGVRASILLPLWRVMGLLTGLLPALFGPKAVYATIDAVETFVDSHYQDQIDRLTSEGIFFEVRDILDRYRLDECHHRDDARLHNTGRASPFETLWCAAVASGSKMAVSWARLL